MADAKLYGIDDNWGKDLMVGFLAGASFIFIFGISGLSMAYPPPLYPQSAISAFVNLLAGFLIVAVLAPLFEEPLFRDVVRFITEAITGNKTTSIFITSLTFSMFHWAVYGEALMAAFVGAFIFSIFATLLTIWTESLLPSIVMHSMVNAWLYLQDQQLLSVAGA